MKVAVTGGKGFIGQAVLDELAKRGHTATILDRPEHDILYPDALTQAVDGHDAVIHLAGLLGTHELFTTYAQAITTNITGACNVLESCSRTGASYVSVRLPDVWRNIYQATKRAAYDMAQAWYEHRGVGISHVRAYNTFGPGQSLTRHRKIIPYFSTQAWAGKPLEIWGSGEQTVDLVWVGDVARMLVDALDFTEDQTFDAANCLSFTVNEVAQMVGEAAGIDIEITHVPMREGETPDTYIKAEGEGLDLLDWAPSWKPDALRETVHWYKPA